MKITAIVSIILFIACAGLVLLFGNLITNEDFQSYLTEEVEQQVEGGGDVSAETLSGFFEQASSVNYSIYSIILILIAAAGFAALKIRKTSPLLSGVFFLAGAGTAVLLFWWLLFPLLPALLYVIVGIAVLINKPSPRQTW
ncbi:hypothetical protein [Alteribacillus sp. HJP-4]|uniref:hypothetical protein n=1 Tax=Alteribacillus sp. HJP-4 TaxID=2775394 RepID=UPI0035CD2B0C